jgi:hypothetical protein
VNEYDAVNYTPDGAIPYVSGGGLKVEKAIAVFNLDF